MKNGIYIVTPKDSILIYGTGHFGHKIKHYFSTAGYHVEGFVDIRGDKIKYCDGLPVWNKEYIPEKETVLVISLQNGMAHKEIAEYYYQLGLRKIIMLPMGLDIPIWKKKIYRESYFKVTNGMMDKIAIPLYCFDKAPSEIIEMTEQYVSFWLPIKYIYTFPSAVMWQSDYSIKDTVSLESLPRHSVIEYYDLFSFLSGNKDIDLTDYLLFQKRDTKEQKETLIKQRKSMFVMFQNALKYDMGFFTECPVYLTWETSKNGFIIQDGYHRVHFFIFMNYREIPGYCSKEDFQQYLNFMQKFF